MSASDTLRSLGRTAVGAAALFVLYPLAFAAGFIGTLAGPAWRAAPDPLQRAGRDLSAYLAARRRARGAVAEAKMRAEVRAAKAAKRAAREERKRLRRAWSKGFPQSDVACWAGVLAQRVGDLRLAKSELRRLLKLRSAYNDCARLAEIDEAPARRASFVSRVGAERYGRLHTEAWERMKAALDAAPPAPLAASPEQAAAVIGRCRPLVRDAELRYAIACAAAGAVPS